MELAGCLQPAWMPRTATLFLSCAAVQTWLVRRASQTSKIWTLMSPIGVRYSWHQLIRASSHGVLNRQLSCDMDRSTFERIKAKHGDYASWAVWAEPNGAPKSNIADLTVLDPARNPSLLEILRNDVVMLGRGFSGPVPALPFTNFHDPNPRGQDYKIRYAFSDTRYYGAYMTNLIKGVIAPESGDLRELLKSDPSLVTKSIGLLLEEFQDLNCPRPLVIAFGSDTHKLADRHIPLDRRGLLVRVTSYGQYISKEDYRDAGPCGNQRRRRYMNSGHTEPSLCCE